MGNRCGNLFKQLDDSDSQIRWSEFFHPTRTFLSRYLRSSPATGGLDATKQGMTLREKERIKFFSKLKHLSTVHLSLV